MAQNGLPCADAPLLYRLKLLTGKDGNGSSFVTHDP